VSKVVVDGKERLLEVQHSNEICNEVNDFIERNQNE